MYKCLNWIPAAFGIMAAVLTGIAILGHLPTNSAEKQETVESRLRRLEDRDAIRKLLMDYGRFPDWS